MTPRYSTLLVALLLVTATVPGAAAAQEATTDEPGFAESIRYSTTVQAVLGTVDRYQDWASQWQPQAVLGLTTSDSGPPTASEQAAELQQFTDGKEQALADYANAHVTDEYDAENHDVVKVRLQGEDDTAVVYAVSETASDDVTNVSVANTTDRTVDYTVTLDEYATREAVDDVEWTYDNYVEPDRAPADGLRARFSSKYAGHVDVEAGDV